MASKNSSDTRPTISSPAEFIGLDDPRLISFGSGQPDLPPPPEILETLDAQKLFKYGPINGNADLRMALANDYPGAGPNDFVVTNGASEALDLVFRALYQKYGSIKVLICQPYYYSYPPLVSLAGHTPVFTQLNQGQIDLDDFRAKVTDVKAVIINSPSNPTGRVEELATLHEIEKITSELGVYVISDEVYKDLIYDRENYPIKGENVITINSFSKTYSMCGLRVGYLYATDPELIQAVVDIKVHTSMNTNVIGQAMALKATKVPRQYIEQQTAIWQQRRDTIYDGLKAIGFELWKPEGAFYVLPKVQNASQVVSELFYDHSVIVYDGAWFGAPDRIRLSYALNVDKIEEGLARIAKYMSQHPERLK